MIKTLLFFTFLSLFSFSNKCLAASGGNSSTLGDFTTVMALGGGGAVLGLSTLSFVDEPSKHLKNIMIGGAIGIIIGVGVVAWRQASASKGMYNVLNLNKEDHNKSFSTHKRRLWHLASHQKFIDSDLMAGQWYRFRYTF